MCVSEFQIVVEGVKLFGSPYQPEIGPRRRMAFNTVRGAPETAALWAKVPQDTQVLCGPLVPQLAVWP